MALLRVLPSMAARAFLVVSDMCSKDTAIARYSPDSCRKETEKSNECVSFMKGKSAGCVPHTTIRTFFDNIKCKERYIHIDRWYNNAVLFYIKRTEGVPSEMAFLEELLYVLGGRATCTSLEKTTACRE